MRLHHIIMKTLPLTTLAALCFFLAPVHGTHAAVTVINNLATGSQSFSESLSGPDGQDFFGDPYADHEIAFSFTTGGLDSTLTELAFVASIGGNGTSPIRFELSTGSAVPGGTNPVIIGHATPAGPTPITQLLLVNPLSPTLLAANTTYWLHLTVPAGNDVYSIVNTNTPTLAPGWNLGTTWRTEPGVPWEEINSTLLPKIRMTVVESVPEPQTFLLGACGLLFLFRRKRQHAHI
jgi:hypothetical protein